MNWIKNRLVERTSLDGVVLIACGIAIILAPTTLLAYCMIAYGAWTLLRGEK